MTRYAQEILRWEEIKNRGGLDIYANFIENEQTKNITDSGFENFGSWYSVVRHDRFLYKKEEKFLFVTNNGTSKFNVEFLNSHIAINTLLKLKNVNNLKYELNQDQISIDFYLDSTSIKEILENYSN